MVEEWIIAVHNTENDGTNLYRTCGSKETVKKLLLSFVDEDKEELKDDWEYGPEDVSQIEETDNDTGLYCSSCYSNYHIDYTARILSHIPTVKAEA